ncbi:hypothetical protein [Streptomyces griseoluteus]|uniref:hypothetical protein n=1 Tax=Streptomyces griseoluteus TaxID=29306 RepID=UPI003669A9C4
MTTPRFGVTATGPVLLLLPGGAGHPMGLGPLAARLARRFTVAPYDPPGDRRTEALVPVSVEG